MPVRNTSTRWGAVAQTLHWVVTALVIAQFMLGIVAARLSPSAEKLAMLARHKSLGITILALAVLRLLWRMMNHVPALPAPMRSHERALVRLSHGALYVLLLVLPLTGWMMSSARNFPVSWYGFVQLPDLLAPDRTMYQLLNEAHELLAIALGVVALLHVAAALRHHFMVKDDVLRRMLPFTRT